MEQLNRIRLHLKSEPSQTWSEGQCQAQAYEALLNIKVMLVAEIATYRCLLKDGKDFNLGDALDSSNSMQTIQKITTCFLAVTSGSAPFREPALFGLRESVAPAVRTRRE
ncbi:Keratin, type I cytoskeletal 18 [Saguinus oedipus]|uniref:Keratin, type I cytoskeletal 18 n=1 Tax=Saguinus oedipus TaxID=9490 RepID=A0ABQ9U6H0_SAGOE|nr:Keratin, type I cytoskeletal 18 [Saguinus oedipus]